jgi:hypothetical protein
MGLEGGLGHWDVLIGVVECMPNVSFDCQIPSAMPFIAQGRLLARKLMGLCQ